MAPKTITVRLSKEEREKCDEESIAKGMSISEWIRFRVNNGDSSKWLDGILHGMSMSLAILECRKTLFVVEPGLHMTEEQRQELHGMATRLEEFSKKVTVNG